MTRGDGNKTILLVEDNPDDVELTLRAFEQANIANEVRVVRDGAAALELLLARGEHEGRERGDDPQLVLLDLKLPRVSGLDVLRELRSHERTQLLPVVVLTSSQEERDVVESYRLGANSYVRKPVDFAEFVEATRQLGLYWLVLNVGAPER